MFERFSRESVFVVLFALKKLTTKLGDLCCLLKSRFNFKEIVELIDLFHKSFFAQFQVVDSSD